MYNLREFGLAVLNARKSLNYSQNKVYELSGVHKDTLRKIEKGKVVPTQETLDLLSATLNIDLNMYLLNCRYSYRELKEISEAIEYKIDMGEYKSLPDDIEKIKSCIKDIRHQYFLNLARQLLLLTEAMDLWKNQNMPIKSLRKLIIAMRITTSEFKLRNFTQYAYSVMELKILMNIALMFDHLNSTEKSICILEYCLKETENDSNDYPKVCYNVSYLNYKTGSYEKAFKLSDLAIDICIKNRNFNGIHLIFFIKGMSEYHLGTETYLTTLKKSIHFCEISDQTYLRNHIINGCKQLNINIL